MDMFEALIEKYRRRLKEDQASLDLLENGGLRMFSDHKDVTEEWKGIWKSRISDMEDLIVELERQDRVWKGN